MSIIQKTWRAGAVLAAALALSGCGTLRAVGNLEEGAGGEFGRMWDRWVDSNGDIAVATTWERKVKPGVSVEDIERTFASVSSELNIRPVGELPLSKELESRSGKKEPLLKVYNFCNPETARKMVDFSPHMAAYLPCRVSVVEQADGLWMYTLNMDMMIKMGRKMTPELKKATMQVREAIYQMMEKGHKGDF
jgi:uncharacterized protein (DUF302 family)